VVSGAILLVGCTFFLVGLIGWYFRKPVEEGALGRYDSMLESIAPAVTLVGAGTIILVIIDAALHFLPR
jgi:hypothetical protein